MRTIRRRRKENKTDYHKRMNLLKSEAPRVVFRRTNKYLIAQIVVSHEARDKVQLGLTSKNLLEYGWPENNTGSLKSTPAAYLTGFLLGKKVPAKEKGKLIVDMGMARVLQKGRSFAFLKGLKDAGIDVKCDEDKFPDEDRIKGKHLKDDFSKTFDSIKSKISGSKASQAEEKIK